MDPATLASATLQFPVAPDSVRPSRRISRTSLPKMWIGYALSLLCLAAFAYGALGSEKAAIGVANIFSLAGWVYWLYCIYRIHKVLAEATFGEYPISARRAVGFQLVPLYSLIWSFKWPKEISRFLKQRLANGQLRYGLVGAALVLAALLGTIPTGLHLALLFAAGAYLKRHIAKAVPWAVPVSKAVPWAVPVSRSHKQRVNLAISAGLGAGCGFVLGKALVDVIRGVITGTPRQFIIAAVAIAIASIAAVKFVEPLAEKCRVALGIPHEHLTIEPRLPLRMRMVLFLLLAATSTSHKVLEEHIEGLLQSVLSVTRLLSESDITNLLTVLLFAAGITYSWTVGSRRGTLGAALISTASGAIIGLLVVHMVWGLALAVILVTKEHVPDLLFARLLIKATALKLFGLAMRGAVFGLLVGLAIRQQSTVRRLPGVYAALVTGALLFGIMRHGLDWRLLVNLGFALGWCAGVLVDPHAEAILTGKSVGADQAPKAASAAA